jgi:hypothetical protein
LFVFDRTTTFYRKETFLRQPALNAYQSMVLLYFACLVLASFDAKNQQRLGRGEGERKH